MKSRLILFFLICMAILSCKKPNIDDASNNFQMKFINDEISYIIGDTLKIDIEFENYDNKDIIFPLNSAIFTLNYKLDNYFADDLSFHNIGNIYKDSIDVFSLQKSEKKIITLHFVPIPRKEKMTEGKYSFQLVINVELIDKLGNATKYLTASKNIIWIDVKHASS